MSFSASIWLRCGLINKETFTKMLLGKYVSVCLGGGSGREAED